MALETLLNQAQGGSVLIPGTQEYVQSNSSYFTVFENAVNPSFIVQPTTAQDVSHLFKGLNPLLLQKELSLAIRGTGHTPFAGSANIEGGVTIDLRKLKGISLNADKSIVEIGVGETWGSVYQELETHGLTTGGGRVGRVGVGGLVLGGGLSLYSTRRGFACDSVVDFEIVLASGAVVHANAQENSDLWIALRGGLNNFGVVTSIKMRTFETKSIWGGVTFFMPSAFSLLTQVTVEFVNNEVDEDTHVIASAGYAFGHNVVTCCMYQTQGLENPPSLQPFTSIPDQIESYSTMRTATHIEFCKELSSFTSDGVRSFYATCTILPDATLMGNFHGAWQKSLEGLKSADGFMFSLGFFPLTKSLLQNSKLAGGNAMNIDPADGPLLIVLINPTWNLAEDDERIHRAVEDLLVTFRELASAKGLLHRYVFTNYAYQREDLFQGYGEDGLKRLRETSKKFDPDGIFQTAVPGGFKL